MHLEKKKEKRQRRTQEKNAQMCDGTGYSFIKKKDSRSYYSDVCLSLMFSYKIG